MNRICTTLCLLGFSIMVLSGCAPNFIVKHRSLRAQKPIHVYVNRKLLCVVAYQKKCTRRLKPGRYTFYAEVKGTTQRWGKAERPTPFVVDQQTVIDLHDPNSPRLMPRGATLPQNATKAPPKKR